MSAETAAAVAANVRQTLRTALQVLEQLEQSLRRSGFAEGQESYRKMADTVIGQTLWLAAAGAPADGELREIASRARAIHGLLRPYADAMLRLSSLGELGAPGAAPAEPPAPADPILEALARAGRPLSATALRSELRWGRAEVAERLAALEREGAIRRQASGGRELFRLGG